MGLLERLIRIRTLICIVSAFPDTLPLPSSGTLDLLGGAGVSIRPKVEELCKSAKVERVGLLPQMALNHERQRSNS